jgi:hypothetical protein
VKKKKKKKKKEKEKETRAQKVMVQLDSTWKAMLDPGGTDLFSFHY